MRRERLGCDSLQFFCGKKELYGIGVVILASVLYVSTCTCPTSSGVDYFVEWNPFSSAIKRLRIDEIPCWSFLTLGAESSCSSILWKRFSILMYP